MSIALVTGSFARVTDPDRARSRWPSPAYASSTGALSMLTLQYARPW